MHSASLPLQQFKTRLARRTMPLKLLAYWGLCAISAPLFAESAYWVAEPAVIENGDPMKLIDSPMRDGEAYAVAGSDGALAVAIPPESKTRSLTFRDEHKTVPEGKELVLEVKQIKSEGNTGWVAIFIGLENSAGTRIGLMFGGDGVYPAKFTPKFTPHGKHVPYAMPCQIRIRNEGSALTMYVEGARIFSLPQPEDSPCTVPYITVARQKPDGSTVAIFSPVTVE